MKNWEVLRHKLQSCVFWWPKVPGDFEGNSWVMPHDTFMEVLSGFIICVVQLSLSTLGLQAGNGWENSPHRGTDRFHILQQAYVADETMYPKVDYDSELPPDAWHGCGMLRILFFRCGFGHFFFLRLFGVYNEIQWFRYLPKDTLATLDMSGVDPHKWRRLDGWSEKLADAASSTGAGPLLLGHRGPNYMRVEVAWLRLMRFFCLYWYSVILCIDLGVNIHKFPG